MGNESKTKRHHFLPRRYLEGFTDGSGHKIFQFDIKTHRTIQTSTTNIGVEAGIYSDGLEKYLADSVENPVNPVFEKINSRERLTQRDKDVFSVYLYSIWLRVPSQKKRFEDFAHQEQLNIEAKMKKFFNNYHCEPKISQELQYSKKAFDEAIKELKEKNLLSEEWEKFIKDHEDSKIFLCLREMKWTFLTTEETNQFLTCDNPIFFSPKGLLEGKDGMSFPISKNISLWITPGNNGLQEGYTPARSQGVKAMNRRTASKASRFVYFARKDSWIEPFLKKKDREIVLLD
jgi:hypothetical protein